MVGDDVREAAGVGEANIRGDTYIQIKGERSVGRNRK
jgi:hypothetical protein